MEERLVAKHLKYEFTDGEQRANARELARLNRSLVEAQLKRKQITGDLKAEESRIDTEIARYSRFVTDGYDFRETQCRVVLNDPKTGIKSLYRVDTGELVEQVAMELHEMQESIPFEERPEESPEPEHEDDEPEPTGNRRPY